MVTVITLIRIPLVVNVVAFTVSLSATVAGQSVRSSQSVQADGAPRPTTPDAAMLAAAQAIALQSQPAEKQNPRLAALLSLSFDRRGESILTAWSKSILPPPPEKPADSKSNEKEADDAPTPLEGEVKDDGTGNAPNVEVQQAKAKQQAAIQEAKAINEEVQQFANWVLLGDWEKVGEYLRKLPSEDATQVYDHLLTGLRMPDSGPSSEGIAVGARQVPTIRPGMPGVVVSRIMRMSQAMNGGGNRDPGVNVLTPADFRGIVAAAPCELSDERLQLLAMLLSVVTQNGHVLDSLVPAFQKGVGTVGGQSLEGRVRAARLFVNAHQLSCAEPFLPDWNDDKVGRDRTAVELWADYANALYSQHAKPDELERAWEIHQTLSKFKDLPANVQDKILLRLTEYSTKVPKELGESWLEESFTEDIHRGIRIVTLLGSEAARNPRNQPHDAQYRFAKLRMQNKAAETLVRMLPDQVPAWRMTLTRLAENWIREGELAERHTPDTSQKLMMQWDHFGNVYYVNPEEQMQQLGMIQEGQLRPIGIRDLLEIKPGNQWLAAIDESLRPQFAIQCARLHLKTQQEADSFPYIEQVAQTHPEKARDLVHQFLTTWTRSHDPNAVRRMYNPYMTIYGYNSQAESIPLTRSKQQRNLAELQEWVARIRALPIEPIDETHLAMAFTTCHSSAEVYRLEAFEKVFGAIDSLKPETIATIAAKMRTNLASVWRRVETQEANQTKRKETDVQQEVLRGYDVASAVVKQAQEAHPDHWQLQLAQAALQFDKNAYQDTVRKDSEFVARRLDAYDQFAEAARSYARALPELDRNAQSTEVYDIWFYAALGATELRNVSHENVPQTGQYELIRKAILELPPAAAEYHMGEFAAHVFERMGGVQPHVKFRYLRGGLAIAGDHPRAREAQRSLDYYTDVVQELKLAARLDGSDQVGDQPFGVFVSLVHTTEMERESGGFEKYVQNQNAMAFVYNYGRPPDNYRDKFQEAVTKVLSEHFEVISVVFENPKNMRSRPTPKQGWRETPFAYILLKAQGKEVDVIPSLQLDLDFIDVNGYVVIPIESPPVPIDAMATKVGPRPLRNVRIVQTLDERQAADRKLMVEIKATAAGLVPPLEELVDLMSPGFEAVIEDDQGVVPSEFDPNSEELAVLSDRSWLVALTARPKKGQTERDFQFFNSRNPDAECVYQRYDDADLVSVDQKVRLGHAFGFRGARYWPLAAIACVGLLGVIAAVIALRRGRASATTAPRYHVPHEVNPFTVLSLLYRIHEDDALDARVRTEAGAEINRLQQHYFARSNGDAEPDLRATANQWVSRAAASPKQP